MLKKKEKKMNLERTLVCWICEVMVLLSEKVKQW